MKSSLVIEVDSRNAEKNIKRIDQELNNLESSGKKAGAGVDDLGNKFKKNSVNNKLFRDSILSSSKALGMLTGAILSAPAALTGFTIAYAKSAAELKNQATLADANVVEFQRMAVAAQRYGFTQEQLADKLKDFNEKIGEFTATGSGGAKDAFEMLYKNSLMTTDQVKKLSLEMQKLSGPQALQLYVKTLEKAGVSQEQMSFYLESMGSDFTKLIPMLANGGAEMNEWADAAERAGVIMDEKTIAQALVLEKQMALVELQVRGAKNTLMQQLAPALVDISSALFDTSGQGIQFSEVAKVAADTVRVLTAAAIAAVSGIAMLGKAMGALAAIGGTIAEDMSWYEANPIGLAKVMYQNRDTIKSIASDYVSDAKSLYADAEKKIAGVMSDGVSSKIKALSSPSKNGSGRNAILNEELKKWNEDANKEAKKSAQKANRDAERLQREIASIRKEITLKYADEEVLIETELQEELYKIRKAGMGQAYEEQASKRAYFEKQIYLSQLQFEINQFKLNEEEKLKYQMDLRNLSIQNDSRMTEKNKQIALQALQEEHDFELRNIQLASQRRILDAEQNFTTRKKYLEELGRIERQEIENNVALTESERERLLIAQERNSARSIDEGRFGADSAVKGLVGELSGNSDLINLRTQLEERKQIIQEAAEWEVINEQQKQAMLAQVENQYLTARRQFYVDQTQAMFGSATAIMKSAFGEQSKAYQVMFAVEKSFAVAQAAMSLVQNVAQASEVGYPYNIPLIAGAFAQGAQIASMISSIVAPSTAGFQTGGYTGNGGVSEVAGVVHRKEYVLNAAATKRVGVDTLNAINSGADMRVAQDSGTSNQTINLTNANFIDPDLFKQFLKTDDGQKAFINTISGNSSEVKRALR